MIPLFYSDLRSYKANLETLQPSMSESERETSEKALHGLAASARLVGFQALSDLVKALENLLILFKQDPKSISQNIWEAVKRAQELLKSLAAEELSQFPQAIEAKKTALSSIEKELHKIPDKKSPAEKPPAQKVQQEVLFDRSMMELFRTEVETQVEILTNGIVQLERGESPPELLEALMRAAHSVKGAARVVRLEPIVQVAHAIEDCFVAAQKKELQLLPAHIDSLLEGIDLIAQLSHLTDDELQSWLTEKSEEITRVANQISGLKQGVISSHKKDSETKPIPKVLVEGDRILRVSAQNLNRLMGLAGESLVESRWLLPFGTSLLSTKKQINELSHLLDLLKETADQTTKNEPLDHYLAEVTHKVNECGQGLNDRLADLDLFILRHSSLSDRLYREVIDSRMRPFSDGIGAFPRLVRDLARELGKKVHLEIVGAGTPVDRDILEKLEAPLSHLLRNAVDHGIETPEEREQAGKPAEGRILLEAQHRAGMLAITVSDDGRGLDVENIRKKVIEKNLVQASVAERLTQVELLEFLFLPGFSTAKSVTEISGRGVGLNVVQSMIQEVSGNVRVQSEPNLGMSFHLQLPLTLSVIRALLVEISGESYAFPLARIDRALHIPKEQISQVESRQYFTFQGENIGLIPASQVLEMEERQINETSLPLIVLSDHMNCYGIVVDKFLGERELVVQELDPRLGKVADINSGALMEDGSPILIVDVEDMVRSIDMILSGGRLHKLQYGEKGTVIRRKRILVVDDSITVREVESRLLQNHGFEVQAAVNGMDGWNALRMGEFDLVVTDVDMPRMNGIELIRLIRSDPRLKKLPVMIVSYKEREEDRRQGLEAGANYYFTKSSFHDESLIRAVVDLIGAA